MSLRRLWSFTRVLVVIQGVALLTLGLGVATGSIGDTSAEDWDSSSGFLFAALGAVMLAGLALGRSRGPLGVAMIGVPSLLMISVSWYSPLFLTGLVTLVLVLVTAPRPDGAVVGGTIADA